jgi:RHS repeat-associated protein
MKVKHESQTRAEYAYNGLNWRISKWADTSSPPDGDLNQVRSMYYSANWQLLEELIIDDWDEQSQQNEPNRRMQYVWGQRYIDDIIMRRQDDGNDGTWNDTWYHLTDTLFSTVAIIDMSANLIERVSYDAYGNARHHRMSDLNGDGATTTADRNFLRNTNWGDYGVGDLNRDGIVDSADLALLDHDTGGALPAGQLSAGASGTDNIIGYAGYIFNTEIPGAGLYTVRHRHYAPGLGRWLSRDPIGYVDGMSLYEYVRSSPKMYLDPTGEVVVAPFLIGCGIGGAIRGILGTIRGGVCGGIRSAIAGCCTGGLCAQFPHLCSTYLGRQGVSCVCAALGSAAGVLCDLLRGRIDGCTAFDIIMNTIVGCLMPHPGDGTNTLRETIDGILDLFFDGADVCRLITNPIPPDPCRYSSPSIRPL